MATIITPSLLESFTNPLLSIFTSPSSATYPLSRTLLWVVTAQVPLCATLLMGMDTDLRRGLPRIICAGMAVSTFMWSLRLQAMTGVDELPLHPAGAALFRRIAMLFALNTVIENGTQRLISFVSTVVKRTLRQAFLIIKSIFELVWSIKDTRAFKFIVRMVKKVLGLYHTVLVPLARFAQHVAVDYLWPAFTKTCRFVWNYIITPPWTYVARPLLERVLLPLVERIVRFGIEATRFVYRNTLVLLWRKVLVPLWTHVLVPLWSNVLVPIWCDAFIPALDFIIRGIWNKIVRPLWLLLSPIVLPIGTALIALSTAQAVRESVRGGLELTLHESVLLAGQCLCVASASLTSAILLMHAVARAFNTQIDPLRFGVVKRGLGMLATLIGLPWAMLRMARAIGRRLLGRLVVFSGRLVTRLLNMAVESPLFTIVAVLGLNIALIRSMYFSPLGDMVVDALYFVPRVAFMLLQQAAETMATVRDKPISHAADSTMIIVLVAGSQVMIFNAIRGMLRSLPSPPPPSPAPGSGTATGAGAGTGAGTGTAAATTTASSSSNLASMTVEELNAIADLMTDPRQCGRCGFGPIDYTGCSRLDTHHGEHHGRSGVVSNACPACGWFVSDLNYWPYWDPSTRLEQPRAVVRMRVWGEIVVTVRAAAKALLVPVCLLKLSTLMPMFSDGSTLLALFYIIPWVIENSRTMTAAYRDQVYVRHARRDARRRAAGTGRARAGARAGAGAGAIRAGTVAANMTAADADAAAASADCGAAAENAEDADIRNAVVEPSAALAAILAATPEHLFVAPGDVCSVCMEQFAADVITAVSALPAVEASQALRGALPPIIAFRCGHCLHLECAEQAVAAAEARHVRCPLCREPVSLAGAVSARCFN